MESIDTNNNHTEALFRDTDNTTKSISDLENRATLQYDPAADHLTRYADSFDNLPKTSFRLQFAVEGRCLGVSEDVKPIIKFCNPLENDAFVFEDDKLRSEELGLCVGLHKTNDKFLVFIDCKQAIKLQLVDKFLIEMPENESAMNINLCLSALNYMNQPTNHTKLGAQIGLTRCSKGASSLELLEETSFLKDREALMLPLPETSSRTCNFPACGINKRSPPVRKLSADHIELCQNLAQCVTVLTKTARRPHLVLRLARSLRQQFNVDFPMVVIDDGPTNYSSELMGEIAKFPNMKYIISDSPDVGIAQGRNVGMRIVMTKYFMVLDDDMVVTERSNITKLVEILDSTDAALVGGGSEYAGFLQFDLNNGKPALFHYQRTCIAASHISGFPDCFRCEITSNIFVAKTQDALDVGGWSRELKIMEHKDFFVRLKAAGKKVVYCPAFKVVNDHTSNGVEFVGNLTGVISKKKYLHLRKRASTMEKKLCNHWNIFKLKLIKDPKKVPAWIYDED